jgi:hypothetical protein
MNIITKYSDYAIQSVEYFIDAIEAAFEERDLKGLTSYVGMDGEAKSRIEKINVTKQHPLVSFMLTQLSETRNADLLRSSMLPAVSVMPGNISDGGLTLGQGLQTEIIDDAFITELKVYLDKNKKETLRDLIITKDQINLIIAAYRRADAGSVLAQIHQWRKDEEINVSAWSDNADTDILIGNLLDSIFADIQMGFAGDNSPIINFKYKITKGLTNFNFGRILFGTEYSLTFTNTYNNYTIYSEDRITDHEFQSTFLIPGDE